jgi:hypothetical protein
MCYHKGFTRYLNPLSVPISFREHSIDQCLVSFKNAASPIDAECKEINMLVCCFRVERGDQSHDE